MNVSWWSAARRVIDEILDRRMNAISLFICFLDCINSRFLLN
jgi:hypothetical protein